MYIVDDATVFWDNGSEGNYWDNYTGLDENEDGIGDTPYIIDENNQDNFPLMEPVIILEFPSWIILPLFLTITLVSIILRKSMTRKT
jgi:nitrous oxidase accessory protein NosD